MSCSDSVVAIYWERAFFLFFHFYRVILNAVLDVYIPFQLEVLNSMWNSILSNPNYCHSIFFATAHKFWVEITIDHSGTG